MISKELLQELLSNEVAYSQFFAGLISSETLIDADACNKSISILKSIAETIPSLNMSDDEKQKFNGIVSDSLRICGMTMDSFNNKTSNGIV